MRWPEADTLPPAIGVSGGVHSGNCPGTWPDWAADIPPTLPIVGVGFIITLESGFAGWKKEAIEEVDMDLAGLAGRAGAKVEGDAGNSAADCFSGEGLVFTGVTLVVDCGDETDVLIVDADG